MSDMNCFVSAMDISIHPMLKVKPKIRIPYFRVLSAFVLQISPNDKILEQRLKVYEKNFYLSGWKLSGNGRIGRNHAFI